MFRNRYPWSSALLINGLSTMKPRKSLHASLCISILVFVVLAGDAAGQTARSTPQSDTASTQCAACQHNFGLAGITRVQTMHVNVVEIGDVPPGPCRQVEMVFLNSRGTILGRSVDCVGAGQPVFFDLNGASLEGSTNRTEVRVAIRLTPAEPDRDQSHVVATVEVVDNQTGKTALLVPAVHNGSSNDFSVAVSPNLLSITAGNFGVSTVSTAVTSGGAQSVSLSISGLPAGASASFSPPSITSGSSSVLTIATAFGTPTGNYSLTITATGTSAVHATTLGLAVNLPPQ